MIIKDPTILKDIRAGIVQVPELTNHILRNYSVMEIAKELASYIVADANVKPISISEADFKAHFRITGTRLDENGNPVAETRGRKPGTRPENGKMVAIEK